jgi:hypothetical protein
MCTREKHFASWGYSQHQDLVQLCGLLPILPREKADAFFNEAERVTQDSRSLNEWPSGRLFDSLGSTLAASDRQDPDARWLSDPQSIADGVLMVDTYDPVIATLQCVARVSGDSYLTRVFSFDDIAPVKRLF